MNTVFEAIKKHPAHFMSSLQGRAGTTPSLENRKNHLNLYTAIGMENWDGVKDIITRPEYSRPLEGVVICMSNYSNIDRDEWIEICDLYQEGKLV